MSKERVVESVKVKVVMQHCIVRLLSAETKNLRRTSHLVVFGKENNPIFGKDSKPILTIMKYIFLDPRGGSLSLTHVVVLVDLFVSQPTVFIETS